MPRQIHAEAENYTIELDPEIGAIVHTWTKFVSGERFREGANELLDAIKTHRVSKMIVDVKGIKAHNEADKQWLQEEWMPSVIDAGIEYSVTVHSASALSEMEMERFVDQAGDLPFTYVLASDMDEARQWIAEQ